MNIAVQANIAAVLIVFLKYRGSEYFFVRPFNSYELAVDAMSVRIAAERITKHKISRPHVVGFQIINNRGEVSFYNKDGENQRVVGFG